MQRRVSSTSHRVVGIAAFVVIACGMSLAQENAERAGKTAATGKAAPVDVTPPAREAPSPEMPASAPAKPEAAVKAEKPAGGWWDDVFAERSVPLSKIIATPEAFRDVPVSFVVQFHQLGKAGTTFFTRFDPDTWLAFSAWADDAALWEKKAFEADFPHLFVRRDGPDLRAVSSAAVYDRLAVSGVVRDVIKGQPWIEVTSVRTLPEKMNEASLVRLVKGLTLRDHRRFDAAAREFEAADADTLPIPVRLVGMREHAYALLNSKKPRAAEERLMTALSMDPENAETVLALAHIRDVAKTMPPERVTTVKTDPTVEQPPVEDEEPVVPGPPDPLADRPKRKPGAPIPKKLPMPAEDEEPVVPGPPDPLADRPKKKPGLPFPKRTPADSRPGVRSSK
jgi:outer membrane biosynthesis protein TonB